MSNGRALKPLKLVVNPGNGCAGPIIERLEKHLPFEFVKMDFNPDGTFPNGVPNPMLEDNRRETSAAVKANEADLGIAWDGDFDRCFFLRRERGLRRGLLHRRPAGRGFPVRTPRSEDHSTTRD